MDQLENFRGPDGKLKFLLQWPGAIDPVQGPQIWKQTSNPTTTNRREERDGYEEIEVNCHERNWGGLAKSNRQQSTMIDGSVGDYWYYAIAAKKEHKGGIPACGKPKKGTSSAVSAQVVELYVWDYNFVDDTEQPSVGIFGFAEPTPEPTPVASEAGTGQGGATGEDEFVLIGPGFCAEHSAQDEISAVQFSELPGKGGCRDIGPRSGWLTVGVPYSSKQCMEACNDLGYSFFTIAKGDKNCKCNARCEAERRGHASFEIFPPHAGQMSGAVGLITLLTRHRGYKSEVTLDSCKASCSANTECSYFSFVNGGVNNECTLYSGITCGLTASDSGQDVVTYGKPTWFFEHKGP
jgi:hypothetical protein